MARPSIARVHWRRALLVALLVLAAAGCGIERSVDERPVPPGPLVPPVPALDGGPPIECRGVPQETCQSFGNQDQPNVVRVIVTCTEACTPTGGSVRIDVLRPNNTTEWVGNGTYSGGDAPIPAPPEFTPQPEY